MKRYDTKDIRNVALVGHGGAGKTSLAEAILFDARSVTRLGVAGSDSSTFDFEPEEVKRQHSMQTSVAWVEWQKKKLNLIDTPGDQNFLVDTRVAMQEAADAAVIVVSCPDRVQVVTEKVWQYCADVNLPRAIFVNKMDRDRADFDACMRDLKERLSDKASALHMPFGKESGFKGVIDLLHMKAYLYMGDGREPNAGDVPGELRDEVTHARQQLIEDIASTDDALLEKYLGTGELSEKEIHEGLAVALRSGALVPVLCGSATKNVGVQQLLDFIVDEFPAPDQRPVIAGTDASGHALERKPSPDEPFLARVFKVTGTDIGKVALVRVLSGKLSGDTTVANPTREHPERTGALYAVTGKKRETATEAVAGDIIGLAKLKLTKAGDTLCEERGSFRLPPLQLPAPVIRYAIRTRSKGDEDKLGTRLHDITDEDIALTVERDPYSKEVLLCGMGQSHIELTVDKLHRMGLDIELLPPKIPYLETIRGAAKNVEGKHKKQTGGKGQFGVCYIDLEPLPRGSGFEFVDDVVGGSIPRQFIPAVEKGMRDRMTRGVVAGYPITDIRVRLFDGKYHDVDSDARSFERAGSKALQEAFRKAKPVLLEPVMEVEVTCPEENMGDVMGDINSRRGRVLGMESKGRAQVVKAHVPMVETLKYAADLKSRTGGRGSFSLEFHHYDELPSQLAEKVMGEHKHHEDED